MPQITVTEIDQSVVTRVVSDDKVKILCPIIASFGPSFDETEDSVKTFTDVTDFNRTFGYTYAEFNPFEDDKSRMYARELLKKGAAVSVVRVNTGGDSAVLNIEGSDASARTISQSASFSTVCPSALNSKEITSKIKTDGNSSTFTLGKTNIVPGTVTATLGYTGGATATVKDYLKDGKLYWNTYTASPSTNVVATIDYATGVITPITGITTTNIDFYYIDGITDWTKYTFAPQILGIRAKYFGSFGDDLIVSISQINTTRLAESYQYANISVYYIDKDVNYKYDETTGLSLVSSQVVKSITLLENKLVSTNPDSPDYFEDVEFDFIRIDASSSARSELALVWSNINANPTATAQYSGFPVLPLKYTPVGSQSWNYNFDSVMTGGSDFDYSSETLEKLKVGFKGYWTTEGNWSVADVDKYTYEVYGGVYNGTTYRGIIPATYETITNTYKQFTDPYMYDFDFITDAGFIYEEYDVVYQYKSVEDESITLTEGAGRIGGTNGAILVPNTVTINGTVSEETVTYTDDGSGKLVSGSTQVGTIVYTGDNKGNITITTAGITNVKASYTCADTTQPQVAKPKLPYTEDSTDSETGADAYTAYYTAVTPIHQSMLELVNTRQDCIALFDLPRYYDKRKIVDYSLLLNTSYGTIHHPWCWINSPDIAGKQILMCPSYIFLYTFLSNLINNEESQKWFPPAGVERATARVVKRPDYEIGSTILNIWQNDGISRVNPIMKLKQYGYVIYGQYTTLPAIDVYTHSALESLNVRLIANVVKKKIFDACLKLAFNPNTPNLWLKFFAELDPYLRYMKYNDGLYDYKIVMDSSTVTTDDINHLRCPGKVFIAPTRTAEFFDIDFIITDAGAVFND